jgi:hypothetical protein
MRDTIVGLILVAGGRAAALAYNKPPQKWWAVPALLTMLVGLGYGVWDELQTAQPDLNVFGFLLLSVPSIGLVAGSIHSGWGVGIAAYGGNFVAFFCFALLGVAITKSAKREKYC